MTMMAAAAISAEAPRASESGARLRWGQLVPAAAQGDQIATRRLLTALGPRVLGAVRRVLGYGTLANDAEDVTQESLLAVVRALPGLREPSKVVGFATRTAVRNALRHRRRGEASRTVALDEAGTLPDDARDPAADLIARQRVQLLLSVLDELPETQSEALALRFCLGHSLEEVADVMQCPINTVRSRVRLGREAIAKKLSKRAGARELLGGHA